MATTYAFAVTQRYAPLAVGLLLALGATSAAAAPATLDVANIRPGQKGYGLTVFRGFKVERFQVEVIDVLRNFLPKQDIILMRGDHAVLRRAGVLGGMSGSPIYLDGKLVGALAYGWRFSKEPIFGVTPIANMLQILKRKARGPAQAGALVADSAARSKARVRRLLARLADRTDPFVKLGWPRPRRRWPKSSVLVPVSVPLSVAGLSPRALPNLKRAFAAYGFEPLQGGGTGKVEGPKKFEVGGAIGVRLVSGDVAMTGTGTVTHMQGNKVLAFGHSMFNAGEIYLPVVSAKIIHPLASVSRSFKLSTPARQLGMLMQDRQAGIMADTTGRVAMIPMTVNIKSAKASSTYKVQLAKHKFLTPSLVRNVLTAAVKEAMSDVAASTFSMTTRFSLKGLPSATIREDNFSSGGLRLGLYFSRGVRALQAVTNNAFAPAALERVDIDIDVTFGQRPQELIALSVGNSVAAPGSTVQLEARFRDFGGKESTRTFPVKIPRDMRGGIIVLELAGGRYTRPDTPTPKNLRQLLAYVQQGYSGKSLVLSIYLPTEGLTMDGRVLKDLPESVLDTLRSGTTTGDEQVLKTKVRRIFDAGRLISGRKQIRLRVKSEVNQ